MQRLSLLATVLLFTASGFGQAVPAGPSDKTSYFEFGTVVSIGQSSVDLQTTTPAHTVRRFNLTADTRADVVRIGDTIEVIYTPSGTDLTARRLVLLNAGIPKAGPPLGAAGIPVPQPAAIGRSTGSRPTSPQTVVIVPPPTKAASAPAGSQVNLGAQSKPKPATVIATPMAAPPSISVKLPTPRTKDIAHDAPAQECNRSVADWPAQPLSMAVLDFRYPTEREEAHDVGKVGGGSGTAVADLVYSRLQEVSGFAISRGDRDKLYRGDFAGAARLGRKMGVDAVLAGTFQPVDANDSTPKAWELRAGIVDTCTGQLLMRLSSAICPNGIDLGTGAEGARCQRFSVTAKQALTPESQAEAFKVPLDALLAPLEHSGTPLGQIASGGVITAIDNEAVTLKLTTAAILKTGDQLAIHAWRLTKNPSTYTLHNLQNEEIGRVTIASVQGRVATGLFTGDFSPKVGDTAETVAAQ